MPKLNTPRDPYNILVQEGQKCAYNYQGQVRLGRITRIFNSPKPDGWGNPKYVISVKEEMTGDISKVGNPKNLVVLPG